MTTATSAPARPDATASEPISLLLARWGQSRNSEAARSALPRVYDQLRGLARRALSGERREHTLQPTALVHEAYLRLVDDPALSWCNRAQFLGTAACLMRRVLIDHARHRNRVKRGGRAVRITLSAASRLAVREPPDVEALHLALSDLSRVDPLKAAIVEMRLFGGLTLEDTAECLGVAPITVSRHWRRAKAWLYSALTSRPGAPGASA